MKSTHTPFILRATPKLALKIHFFEEGLLELIISKGNAKLGLRDPDLLVEGGMQTMLEATQEKLGFKDHCTCS